jgi:hypothetical protein
MINFACDVPVQQQRFDRSATYTAEGLSSIRCWIWSGCFALATTSAQGISLWLRLEQRRPSGCRRCIPKVPRIRRW